MKDKYCFFPEIYLKNFEKVENYTANANDNKKMLKLK
jgi:hypothetical protein